MTTTTGDGKNYRLTRLEVENFKRITTVDIAPLGNIVEISGNNGAGKSSCLDAINALLRGVDSASTPEPIHEGCERSTIKGTFGELLITRVYRRKDGADYTTSMTIENPDGAQFKSPQKKLDELIGEHMPDPLEFVLAKDDKVRMEVIKRLDPSLDFDAADAAHKIDFEKRTGVNSRLASADALVKTIVVGDQPDGIVVDVAALETRLANAGTHNVDVERRRNNRNTMTSDIAALCEHAKALLADVETRSAQIYQRFCDDIADIDRQIAELQARKSTLESRAEQERESERARITTASNAAAKDADEKQAQLDAAEVLPEVIDVVALQAELQMARETNAAHTAWQTAVDKRNEYIKAADVLRQESDELTARITERKAQKAAAIAKANLPIDGLGFEDGVVMLNGHPFVQASQAEKLRTAVAISMALHPRLRMIWIRDAALLDDSSLAIVSDLAREYDMQVFLETVRPISGEAIVLQDGRVKNSEVKSNAA